MRFVVRRDFKRRIAAVKVEKRNKFFQAMLRIHQDWGFSVVYQGMFLMFSKRFLIQAKNRCQYTFSKHSVIRFYHLGRHVFRANASFGTFYGLQKASW